MNKDNIRIEGHRGTWYIIDEQDFRGGKVYLLEHETYGDEAACLIVDGDFKVIADDVWNGFDDLANVEEEDLDFSTWRRQNGYKSYDAYLNEELSEGKDTDEIEAAYNEEVIEQFETYCEENRYNAVVNE